MAGLVKNGYGVRVLKSPLEKAQDTERKTIEKLFSNRTIKGVNYSADEIAKITGTEKDLKDFSAFDDCSIKGILLLKINQKQLSNFKSLEKLKEKFGITE
jgi:hypothetical protein